MLPTIPALVALCIVLAVLLVTLWLMYVRVLREHQREIDAARKQSVNQSRSTLKGKIAEQMAPLLPGFPYSAADSRFLGSPIDYIVFNGYTQMRDAGGDPEELEIILLDVKQGRSQLKPEQRAIRDALLSGRIRFQVLRVDDDGTIEPDELRPTLRD